MRNKARILVIGSSSLGGAVARALPRCESVTAPSPLGGLWTAGHREFEGVVLSLASGQRVSRAIGAIRQIAPKTRIVVTCAAPDEPRAREALLAGADDYVLEPILPEDLEHALRLAPASGRAAHNGSLPAVQDIMQLGDILKNLGEGLQPTLDRLANLLRRAFDAEFATLHCDEISATAGTDGAPVLQETIRHQERDVGQILLGARTTGTYTASDAAQLADYARLIETIVAQVHEQARWRELAWRDDLSGLHNRRYFDATLDSLVGLATTDRRRLTLLLFDIDDFKTYNDHYGHDAGDKLVREVAVLLTRCSRKEDVVARYGGDEFAVILWDAEEPRVPGSKHPTEPIDLAERFRSVIREHAFKCLGTDAPGPVTISGGLACFPWDGKTREELVRAADAALLRAKRNGKNKIGLAGTRGASSESEGVVDSESEGATD